jgi:hypothetical protein
VIPVADGEPDPPDVGEGWICVNPPAAASEVVPITPKELSPRLLLGPPPEGPAEGPPEPPP